jgi:Bacterial PH domain
VAFEAGTLVFSSASARRPKAIACLATAGLGALLLTQMAKNATSVVLVYMGILSLVVLAALVGFVRSFRVGIEVNDDGVTARTTFATRRFAWDEIVEAQAVDRAIRTTGRSLVPMTPNAMKMIQVVPVLRLTNGRRVRLQGLQAHIESDTFTNWLDDAIVEINNRLEERHGLGSGAAPTRPS